MCTEYRVADLACTNLSFYEKQHQMIYNKILHGKTLLELKLLDLDFPKVLIDRSGLRRDDVPAIQYSLPLYNM